MQNQIGHRQNSPAICPHGMLHNGKPTGFCTVASLVNSQNGPLGCCRSKEHLPALTRLEPLPAHELALRLFYLYDHYRRCPVIDEFPDAEHEGAMVSNGPLILLQSLLPCPSLHIGPRKRMAVQGQSLPNWVHPAGQACTRIAAKRACI